MPSAKPSQRGGPGRARVPRREREPAMLKAAAEVFAERGFHAASMDEIARRVGVTKPMLYSYFGSKDGLFAACGDAAAELLRAKARESASRADLTPDERLWHGLLGVFEFIGEHRELWFAFNPPAGASTSGGADAVGARGREAMGELIGDLLSSTALSEGVRPGLATEAAPLAQALTASVLAMAEWWQQHPEEPAELQALRVMNFAWTGFQQLLAGELWMPSS